MTGWRKRQVIELAERASPSKQDWWKDDDALEAFAELVRADERDIMCERFNISKELVHEKAKSNKAD